MAAHMDKKVTIRGNWPSSRGLIFTEAFKISCQTL